MYIMIHMHFTMRSPGPRSRHPSVERFPAVRPGRDPSSMLCSKPTAFDHFKLTMHAWPCRSHSSHAAATARCGSQSDMP